VAATESDSRGDGCFAPTPKRGGGFREFERTAAAKRTWLGSCSERRRGAARPARDAAVEIRRSPCPLPFCALPMVPAVGTLSPGVPVTLAGGVGAGRGGYSQLTHSSFCEVCMSLSARRFFS